MNFQKIFILKYYFEMLKERDFLKDVKQFLKNNFFIKVKDIYFEISVVTKIIK